MHKVNLGLPVSGVPGNLTPSLVADARRNVDGDERDGKSEREREKKEGDVVGLDGCLVPTIPVSAGARLVAARSINGPVIAYL
jgi:hypothetical protein